MRLRKNFLAVAALPILGMAIRSATAASVSFLTPAGSSTSGPVSAEADFTTSAGAISITLTNFTVNPGDVAQDLSALTFTLNIGTLGSVSLTSGTGVERSVLSGGTYSVGSTVNAGWALSNPATSTLELDVLSGTGHAGPEHTLLGDPATTGKYDAANSSLTNGPHTPELYKTINFTLSVADVTADTKITGATFQFGTTEGQYDITGTPQGGGGGGQGQPTPLPASVWGGGALIAGLAAFRFLKRKSPA